MMTVSGAQNLATPLRACLYLFMVFVVQIFHEREKTGCHTRIFVTISLQMCTATTAGSLGVTRIVKD
jgi:hypothetical protein